MARQIRSVDHSLLPGLFEELRAKRSRLLATGPDAIQRRAITALSKIKIARITPKSPEDLVSYSLGFIVNGWSEDRLAELVHSENALGFSGTQTCLHIIASNTPILAWTHVARALLVQSASVVRVPDHPGVKRWTGLFVDNLEQIYPDLADLIELVTWPSSDEETTRAALIECDKALVFGSDETVQHIQGLASGTSKLLPFGNRISLGIVKPGADFSSAANGFCIDMAIFDQQGCLSPQMILVIGTKEDSLRFSSELKTALDEVAFLFPERTPDSAAKIREALGVDRLVAISEYLIDAGLRFAVASRKDSSLRPLSSPGTVAVSAFTSLDDALDSIRKSDWNTKLQGVGIAAGDQSEFDALAETLKELGVHYICEPGKLQTPPFDWKEDGYAPLGSLM